MAQKYEEGELEKGIEQNEFQVNEMFQNLSPQKTNCIDKLNIYKKQILEFIKKRQMIGEEAIQLFPISYFFTIGMGVAYLLLEEINWFVVSLISMAIIGIFMHYIKIKLALKIILRLIFTSLLLYTIVSKVKVEYFSAEKYTQVYGRNDFYMNLFLSGHIFIILNDEFGVWEIDFIITLMQASGIIYLSGGFSKTFSFWSLFLFPFYLFFKKFQSEKWIHKYFSLSNESAHLYQIFNDLWPHKLFVTSLDSNNQVQVKYFNRKAKHFLTAEKSFSSLFKKIKFSQLQKESSNISLGTYSKKDNLWKLLETKHRKFEEQISASNQQLTASPTPAQTLNQIIGEGMDVAQQKQSRENTKSIKIIPQSSNSPSKRHHHQSSLQNRQRYTTSNTFKSIYFDATNIKRKSTLIGSDGENQFKNTQAECDEKIDKYQGMYYYSQDDPEKFKSIKVKIYYYNSKADNVINQKANFITQKQRFLFVELKTLSEDKYEDSEKGKSNPLKVNEKFRLLKMTKRFAQDIDGHFKQIIAPYKQLVDQLVYQQFNSQFQQQLQASSINPFKLQQNNILENNIFKFHIEYISAQIGTLIDYLRIQLNKPTKLIVKDQNMELLFSDFFKTIRDSTEKKMEFLLEMDPQSFPAQYKQDSGRVYQILHFLFQRLITIHDCINPKFILKVNYVKKRTESLYTPHSLTFMDSKVTNQNSIAQNEPHLKSNHSHRKSTLKHVSNLYSSNNNSNCFVIELILKGHCNFESVIKKQELKDKDKLFRTIEKLSQYLGSPTIEFITEKDSLLRKYVFSLKEVAPRLANSNIENKQDSPSKKQQMLDQINSIQDQQVPQNIIDTLKFNYQANQNSNEIQNINSPTENNNLEKQINLNLYQNNSNINFLKYENQPLHTPKEAFQFWNSNVFQINSNNLCDSQQSMNAINPEADSQVNINAPLQFQSHFIK